VYAWLWSCVCVWGGERLSPVTCHLSPVILESRRLWAVGLPEAFAPEVLFTHTHTSSAPPMAQSCIGRAIIGVPNPPPRLTCNIGKSTAVGCGPA
jgi:hypothetical protein